MNSCRSRPRKWHRNLALLAGVVYVHLLTACSEIPELDAAVPDWVDDASYPDLVPLDRALAKAPLPRAQSAEIEEEVANRAAQLKARAERLNTPVVDEQTRNRMEAGVDS